MNKWLVVFIILIFFLLTIISVLFGGKIRALDLKQLQITRQPSSVISVKPTDQPRLSVIAENLEIPWALAFLPDGGILFTERPGRVRLIAANSQLQQEPVMTFSDVNPTGEGGLLGITIHPDFTANKFVYFYYSYGLGKSDMKNRVVRYVFDGQKLNDRKVIVDGIPGNSNHDGGRIKFGSDGYLYITTGDSEQPSLAQDKNALAGKILRVTGDGDPAPGNPFGSVIYSYGHRNPQGLAWDDKGRLWATEHGRSIPLSGLDELNIIESGKNYGWPTIQGDQKKDGMVTPVINSGATTTWAPAGAAYYNGSIFFGGLKGEGLYEAVITDGNVVLKKHFDKEFGRIRDVVLSPNNMLYITTSNRDGRGIPKANDDKIYRVNPAKL